MEEIIGDGVGLSYHNCRLYSNNPTYFSGILFIKVRHKFLKGVFGYEPLHNPIV